MTTAALTILTATLMLAGLARTRSWALTTAAAASSTLLSTGLVHCHPPCALGTLQAMSEMEGVVGLTTL